MLVRLNKSWYENSFGGFNSTMVDLVLAQFGSGSSPAKTTHLCLNFCDASAKKFVDFVCCLFPLTTQSLGPYF